MFILAEYSRIFFLLLLVCRYHYCQFSIFFCCLISICISIICIVFSKKLFAKFSSIKINGKRYCCTNFSLGLLNLFFHLFLCVFGSFVLCCYWKLPLHWSLCGEYTKQKWMKWNICFHNETDELIVSFQMIYYCIFRYNIFLFLLFF